MKTYYVYLVIIWHPKFTLYYVGKHAWHGVGIDPLYEGSCTYRFYKKWLADYRHSVRVLEWTTKETTDEREKYWILKCLRKHGSFLYGTFLPSGTPRSWLDEFGKGFCLNGHWGSSELVSCCLTPEAIAKSHETHVKNGSQERFMQKSAACSKEAYKASLETRKRNGSLARAQMIATRCNQTPEARKLRVESFKRNATQFKVIAPDGTEFEGCQSEIEEFVSRRCGKRVTFHRLRDLATGKLKSPWTARWGNLVGYTFSYVQNN